MVSPDNGLIEFVVGPEGKVIREIDNDPNSPGFRKPLREYTYAGDRGGRLVSYHYSATRCRSSRPSRHLQADGSIDQFHESTDYEHENQR